MFISLLAIAQPHDKISAVAQAYTIYKKQF